MKRVWCWLFGHTWAAWPTFPDGEIFHGCSRCYSGTHRAGLRRLCCPTALTHCNRRNCGRELDPFACPTCDRAFMDQFVAPPRCPDGYWQHRCMLDEGHAGEHRTQGDDGDEYRW
jgi:hypothetical protein